MHLRATRRGRKRVLELTVVRLFWFFNWSPKLLFLLVFWSIGMSMIILGALAASASSDHSVGILRRSIGLRMFA